MMIDRFGKAPCLAALFAALLAAGVLLVLSQNAHAAGLSQADIDNTLARGEEAFRGAMELDRTDPKAAGDYYRKAILHFERIVGDGGIRNGRIYYNIGNTYFRLGDLGRAILYYRRASLYAANDQNLRQNLEHARSRRVDRIERKQRERIFKTLFFLHYDVPSRIRFMIFLVSFAALWISASTLLLLKKGFLKLILVVSAVVSAAVLVSLAAESYSLSRRPGGVITAVEVEARKGDAETYQPSFTEPLHAGTEFRLLEERSGWCHVELDDGARTWIPSASGELVIK